jgi:membrane-associated phospholipid phosphatase
MSSPTTTNDRRDRSASGVEGSGWKRVAVVTVLTWLIVCALVVGWGWLLTHPLESSIDPTDDDVARWFADQRDPTLTDVANAGTFLGETIVGASTFAVLGLLVSLLKRSWRPILLVAIVEAGIGGFYFFGTELVSRDRPPVKLLDPGLVPEHSYPSGHVATALVCWAGAVVLVWTYFRAARWVALPLLLLPLATLVSRLYLGAHHLTDALTSVVYASVWLLVVAGVLLPRRDVRTGRAPRGG